MYITQWFQTHDWVDVAKPFLLYSMVGCYAGYALAVLWMLIDCVRIKHSGWFRFFAIPVLLLGGFASAFFYGFVFSKKRSMRVISCLVGVLCAVSLSTQYGSLLLVRYVGKESISMIASKLDTKINTKALSESVRHQVKESLNSFRDEASKVDAEHMVVSSKFLELLSNYIADKIMTPEEAATWLDYYQRRHELKEEEIEPLLTSQKLETHQNGNTN